MEELLNRIVRLHGLEVGRVVDAIMERDGSQALGLEILCKDGEHRFLPLATANPVGNEIVIDSPFALLDGDQLGFYRERGVPLRGRSEPAA